jgi:hypothetical protein
MTVSLPYNQREAGVPVCLQDTPRVNPLAVPNRCAPPAWRDLWEAGRSHDSRDAGAGGSIRDTLTSQDACDHALMRAARVPALFSMTPTNHPNSLAAQRYASPSRASLVETLDLETTARCPNAGIARAQRESGACHVGPFFAIGLPDLE